jgi:hypothetical protein
LDTQRAKKKEDVRNKLEDKFRRVSTQIIMKLFIHTSRKAKRFASVRTASTVKSYVNDGEDCGGYHGRSIVGCV